MNDRGLKFKGTHKEIGEQVGMLYKKWGHTYSYMPPFANEFYPKQLKIYEKFYPQHLDFLTGVAKGLNVDKDIILKFSLTIFLSEGHKITKRSCSIFGVNNDCGVFIGRNYDWLESSELSSKFLQYDYTDKSSFSFKGISDMGTYKLGKKVGSDEYVLITDDAWNEKIYIGLNGAPGKKGDTGISMPHVVQLIATNHFNHRDLLSLNALIFDQVPFHSTFARYHYLEANLVKKWQELDFKDIIPLLNKPPLLQNWRGVKMGDTVTDWILSLNLQNGKYRINFAPLLKNNLFIAN